MCMCGYNAVKLCENPSAMIWPQVCTTEEEKEAAFSCSPVDLRSLAGSCCSMSWLDVALGRGHIPHGARGLCQATNGLDTHQNLLQAVLKSQNAD